MRLFLLLLLLTGLVGPAGCRRKGAPPLPEIAEVRVRDRGDGAEGAPALDLAALTRGARAAIATSSGLPVAAEGAGGAKDSKEEGRLRYRLQVTLQIGSLEDFDAKKGNLRALVDAKLTPLGDQEGPAFAESALVEHAFALGAAGEPAWQAHAERAVRDCVESLGARVRLARGDTRALLVALEGSDADLREEALRFVGERKERAAVPVLIRLLHSEDAALRDRAIGALSAIGDERAVRPLTEVAKFSDIHDLPKVLDALSAIGGPEARAYLEFVASGHPLPSIRELATQALGHLEQRQAARAKPAPPRSPLDTPAPL